VATKAWKGHAGLIQNYEATSDHSSNVAVDDEADISFVDPLKQAKLPAARLKPITTNPSLLEKQVIHKNCSPNTSIISDRKICFTVVDFLCLKDCKIIQTN